jgi:hypothetical protein
MEEQARERRAGLWHDPHPVPPWDFRSSVREHVHHADALDDDGLTDRRVKLD